MDRKRFHDFYSSQTMPVKVYCEDGGKVIPVIVTSYGLAHPECTEKSIGYRFKGKKCRSSVDFLYLTEEEAYADNYESLNNAPLNLFTLEENCRGLIHGAKGFVAKRVDLRTHQLILVDKYDTEKVVMENSGNLSYQWAVPHLNALFIEG